jgi:diacylglycerol O-acyltransferase / wax synthase
MTTRIGLSVIDRTFLLAETRETPMHVGGLQIFKVPVGASARFVSSLAAKLRTYPVTVSPLNYRLTGGFTGKVLPSWEIVKDVDLNYHFRRSALPRPGGERELGVLVSRLHSNPMDLSRPLWEYHLIEGLADHRFAVYTKLHHAMVDGAGAMRLANLASDPAASFAPPFWADESRQPQEPSPKPKSLLEWLPATIQDEVKSLPGLVRGLATTAQTALGVAAEPDLTSITEAPRTMLNVRVGGQRRVATYSASLQRIKAIGEAAGGTINDVVLAACSGALRRYLAERDALPQQSLISAVPVALHHDERAAAGNAVTCLNARLGTDIEDVRQRFGVICRSTAAGKTQLKGMTQTAAMHFVTLLSLPMLLNWLPGGDKLLGPQSNLIISNVPGSRERLYFHGAEMVAHFPVSQVGHGMALNITVLSYAGGLYFGFVACADGVPSVQRLSVHMDAALGELESVFAGRPPRADGKARSSRNASPGKRPSVSRARTGGARRPR